MRVKGKIKSWNDEKGFGFIDSSSGGKDVFLHISAFGNRDRRPEAGQTVTYALATDERGRPRAVKATLPGERLKASGKKRVGKAAVIIASAFLVLVALAALFSKTPWVVLWVYLGLSLVTFFVYALDKAAAKDGARRTPENMLHWLALAGGWPGAIVAQETLRHKSKKQPFRTVFWMTVVLNLCAFGWTFTPSGAAAVQSWISSGHTLIAPGQRATIEWAE